jgi:pSer/pThr/pTyr-binding forkhead associated (FHA) protein
MQRVAGLHQSTPAELKAQLEAERAGRPFLLYREPDAGQAIVPLATASVTVGRGEGCDVCLAWDGDVSRVHAELEQKGGVWTVSDDGLSRNGTYVNGERVSGRRRLRDGDSVRFGATVVRFREPSAGDTGETRLAGDAPPEARVSEAQKRVLVALCRPFRDGSPYATPATNQAIAAELFLSVDAVKTHMRALFDKFDVGDVPQNQKRAKLVERAFNSGAIGPKDLA